MKKLIIILAVMLVQCVPAQNITIIGVSPSAIIPGDNLLIQFRWDYIPGSFNFCINGQGLSTVHNVLSDEFYGLQKTFNGTDTIYIYELKTNPGFNYGSATFYLIGGQTFDITMKSALTGIEQYGNDNLKIKYFDLTGKEVNPEKNIILIEQKGTIRRKVIIQ